MGGTDWGVLGFFLLIVVLVPFGLLWLKRGPGGPDDSIRRWLVLLVGAVGSALILMAVAIDADLFPEALVQAGAAVIAGAVVGVLVIVLRD